jgi:hypothetical protein
MVYAHKVCRVTLSGTMFGGTEVWSTGFFVGAKDADTAAAPNQAAADAVRDAWTTFFISDAAKISKDYQFTTAKLASIADDGHTVLDEVVYSYPATTISGYSTHNQNLPPQCSLVCTLTTVRPRGLASKGRMYLPGVIGPVLSTGKLSSSDVTGISNGLKTFFDAVNASSDVPGQIILAAKGTGLLPALTAQNEWVTGFRVGDVVDTQRRRRNNLVEVYTLKTLA